MQTNQNLNQATAKLDGPYKNLPQTLSSEDSQINDGESAPIGSSFHQPQELIDEELYSWQNRISCLGKQDAQASEIKCLCLTAVVENLLYIILDVIILGLKMVNIHVLFILEIVIFSFFLFQIKRNGSVLPDQFKRIKKIFIAMLFVYVGFFFWEPIFLGDLASYQRHRLFETYLVALLIFLLPRFIALWILPKRKIREQLSK